MRVSNGVLKHGFAALAVSCMFAGTLLSFDGSALAQSHYSSSGATIEAFNSGLRYEQEEQWSKAEAQYRKVIEMDDTMTRAYSRLGYVLYAQKKGKEAVPMLEQALKKAPNDDELQLVLGLSLIQAGDNKKAQQVLSKVNKLSEEHPEAYFMMGKLQLDQKKYDEAQKNFERYTSLQPKDIQGLKALVLASIKNHDYETARLALERILNVEPKNFTAVLNMGHILYEQGNYPLALEYYQKALRLQPNHNELYYIIGSVQFLFQKYKDAISTFDKLLERNPQHFGALYFRADSYLKLGELDKAENAFQKLYQLKPDYVYADLKLADIKIQKGDAKDAQQIIARMNKGSVNPDVQNYISYLYMKLGKTEEAIVNQKKLVAQEKSNLKYTLFLARFQLADGKIDEAIDTLKSILEKDPDNLLAAELMSYVVLNKGDDALKAGSTADALAYFKQALEYPGYKVAASCAIAQVDIVDGNMDEAKDKYHEIIKQYGEDVPGVIVLGAELDTLNGKSSEAVKKLLELEKSHGLTPGGYYLLSIAQIGSSDWLGADKAYQAGSKLGLFNPKLEGVLAIEKAVTAYSSGNYDQMASILDGIENVRNALDSLDKFRFDYLRAFQAVKEKKYSQALRMMERVNAEYGQLSDSDKSQFTPNGRLSLDYELAVLYIENGRIDSALNIMQNKRGSEYDALQLSLRRQAAKQAFNEGKYGKAREYLDYLRTNGKTDNRDEYNYDLINLAGYKRPNVDMLRSFANQGNTDAMLNYAIYLDGNGQPKEAYSYYRNYVANKGRQSEAVQKVLDAKERVWGK